MATRLYFVANTAADVSPNFDASWQSTSGAVRRKMATTKDAATETRANVAVTSGAGNETLGFQLISEPLNAGSVSGTVNLVSRGRELAAQDNIGAKVRSIRVCSNDGTSFTGTLLTLGNGANTTEMAATLAGHTHASATALSSVAANAGDRIVVEIGYGMTTTGTTPLYDMVIGGSGTDHANTEGDTTGTVPWVEFSANLSFQVPPVEGQALGAYTFGSTATGFPTKQGQAAGTYTFDATAAGLPTKQGVALGAYTFTAAAGGESGSAPPVQGQAAGAYTFTGTATGVRGTTGQAVAALSFTALSAGTVTVEGAGISTATFTATAIGVRTVNGQAAAPLTFTAAASGESTVYGQLLGALAFTATAAGVVQGASVEVFGTGLGAYTFTATAAGGPPAGPADGPHISSTRFGRRVAATRSGAFTAATPMRRPSERA